MQQTLSRLRGGLAAIRKSAGSTPTAPAAEPRVVALDGLRGLMTIMVVLSHFFGEIENGIHALCIGWIAVIMFFVLSGYLVGRLILEKMDRANFVRVFYIRRVCRTLPVYIFCVFFVFVLTRAFAGRPWANWDEVFPLWSYLTFFQNFFMVSTKTFGAEWLAPTWTLAVEEQFYLLGPAVFFLVPRRYLIAVFSSAIGAALIYRYAVFELGLWPKLAGLCLLPGVADGLICGLIAAILIKTDAIKWARYDMMLRVGPIIALVAVIALKTLSGKTGSAFDIWSELVVAVGCAMYILAIVRGSPEGKRLEHPFYCFFGTNSYAIYLTHLTVIGLMHGLILNLKPDIDSLQQLAVTIAALPVTAFVGWVITQVVERPITAYGRSWKWSNEKRQSPRADLALPGLAQAS